MKKLYNRPHVLCVLFIFSDGTLEVYSSSESDGDDDEKSQHQSGKTNSQSATSPKEIQAAINPKSLR